MHCNVDKRNMTIVDAETHCSDAVTFTFHLGKGEAEMFRLPHKAPVAALLGDPEPDKVCQMMNIVHR